MSPNGILSKEYNPLFVQNAAFSLLAYSTLICQYVEHKSILLINLSPASLFIANNRKRMRVQYSYAI